MTDSIIQHLLENKKHTANHRNSKKTTTFVFNKCSVTYLRKCPIIQHLVSDSGHSQKRLKESGTTHICKAMKYTDLHLSPHSVYLSKQRLYRLKWTVTDNQWCKYAASRFECYRNKAVEVEAPVTHPELTESTINSEPIISEPPKLKSKLHLTQQKKFLRHRTLNPTKTWQNYQRKKPPLLPSTIYLSKNLINQ